MGQKPRSAKHEILWGKGTKKTASSLPAAGCKIKYMALEQSIRVCKARAGIAWGHCLALHTL